MNSKLLEYMKVQDLDGFFVSKLMNVRYISGYTSDDAYLLITKEGGYFLTDPRYTEQAGNECPDYTIINWRAEGGSIAGAVNRISQGLSLNRVAFEGDSVSYNMYAELTKSATEIVSVNGVIEKMRAVKSRKRYRASGLPVTLPIGPSSGY